MCVQFHSNDDCKKIVSTNHRDLCKIKIILFWLQYAVATSQFVMDEVPSTIKQKYAIAFSD